MIAMDRKQVFYDIYIGRSLYCDMDCIKNETNKLCCQLTDIPDISLSDYIKMQRRRY